ncbi:MAG: sigma 54-interacting transcriptional regulator [Planctomycetota bacterium]
MVRFVSCLFALAMASSAVVAQAPPQELVIQGFRPTLDGDLKEWPKALERQVFGKDQRFAGAGAWQGDKDCSAQLLVSFDSNHLYLAGQVRDDQIVTSIGAAGRSDCIELYLAPDQMRDPASRAADRAMLRIFPLQPGRPWAWGGSARVVADDPVQAAAQLGGITVVGRRLEPTLYEFEAAIPFHHFPALKPGMEVLSFDLVLRDFDLNADDEGTALSWSTTDPIEGPRAGRLRLPAPGLMAPIDLEAPLLSGELFVDLPYLLVPLLSLLLLVLLLRGWARIRGRVPGLRTALVVLGAAAFLIGLWLPSLMTGWRGEEQRQQLATRLRGFQDMLGKIEEGTLKSFRGASRDRAVVDLIGGRSITRQKYTSYRSLVEIAPEQFGPPLRYFDDLPVRCYWLPLAAEHASSFQFDPPLKGKRLHLVLARPFVPTFSLPRDLERSRLELTFDHGTEKRDRKIDLNLPFSDATALGRDFWEACVVPIDLEQDLRALTLRCDGNPDLRLVGVSLEGSEPGHIAPVSLGAPSRDGVLTDLRGPYPQDAGIELAPGAVAKVTIPEQQESPQRLWMFYRAVYPGLPTANPGARVAEVVLHFADGRQKATIVLEHQVSMFYELAVHNTRDDPPTGSGASIALTWVDESQERHVNLGYPVLDLPADTALAAIEFKNLADYRIRFRSVVFVNERAVAPQDPPDSPLLREGNDRRLKSGPLAELEGMAISIYRNGRLSESTLPADERLDVQALPRTVAATGTSETQAVLAQGGRRLTLFAPLRGDGWDGAVLSVSTTDIEWVEAQQSASRTGLLLCLLSTPFLLVLLSELLAAVTNLRFRLMTVMSVASLAPLGLLSLVLVKVLESGHATDVEDGVRATVSSAMKQLEGQKDGVRSSAVQWLRDLAALANEKLAAAGDNPPLQPIAEDLQKLLAGQLPPEWRGGFLRLEWQLGGEGSGDPVVMVAGDERMVQAEAPVRLDPGLFMQWGRLMLGVRAEQGLRGGKLVLTAGRPLDGSLLGALAPGRDLLLTDVRGYPLAASEGRPNAERLSVQAMDPAAMAERERALAFADERRQPLVSHLATPVGDHVFGTDVLRDLQDTPRGLLVVALPDERATLDLAIGRIPVRAFFLLVAGSLVVLAAFLSFVVSGRISRPIERLEHGAQALSRGVLDTRVPDHEGGQVGRLTRAFNQMAADLQGRLQDLQALNRTMGELAAQHDEATAIEVLRRFCASHTGADAVVVTMLDDAGQALVLHGGGDGALRRLELGRWSLAATMGAFGSSHRGGELPVPFASALPQCRSVLGLPIAFAGQARGAVLLGFESAEPGVVDFDLLTTVVAQAASACERAQLQRLAVQDPVTGAFAPAYFRRRVVDEVALAQHQGRSFALIGFLVGERNRVAVRLQRFAELLRDHMPDQAIVGHSGGGRFHVALVACDRARAELLRQSVVSQWGAELRRAGIDPKGGALQSAVAVFPDEAPSSEFLFDAVRAQLATDPLRGAVEAESDASLLRAGVTAVSAVMRPVYSTLRRVAPTDLPILLEGETGVGKEVLTDLVHRWSRRANGPFVKVHCASLSETLLASELFGHERGAFTGAERRKIGRFEQAHGGTLFLDEVGEISLDVQVKLLRALQEGEIDRVGGTESVKVDVRVIAATNRDMVQMVQSGRFREDLYYRLQGMVVRVPPLRERREEIGALVEQFRIQIVRAGHAPDRRLSTLAMDALYRQEWPGNIRQLRTTVFRALVLARGAVVEQRDVDAAMVGGASGPVLEPGTVAGPSRVIDESVAAVAAPVVLVPQVGGAPAAPEAEGGGGEQSAAAGADAAPPAAEPLVQIPAASEPPVAGASPAGELGEAGLSERLRELLARIRRLGRYTTQEHMAEHGLSHRTALRDLQALVSAGLVERVGVRRGAFYRPLGRVAKSDL